MEKTKVVKDMFLGWMGVTWFEIGKTAEGKERILEFTTAKRYSGRVSTQAQVFELCKATGSKTFMVFQDFNAAVMVQGKIRCTEKAITAAHEEAKPHFAAYVEKAKAHYATAA